MLWKSQRVQNISRPPTRHARDGRPDNAPNPSIAASVPSMAKSWPCTSRNQARFSSLGSSPSACSASLSSLFSVRDLRCKVTTCIHHWRTSSEAAPARAGQSAVCAERSFNRLASDSAEISRLQGPTQDFGLIRQMRRAGRKQLSPATDPHIGMLKFDVRQFLGWLSSSHSDLINSMSSLICSMRKLSTKRSIQREIKSRAGRF